MLEERISVEWGNFSQVECELLLMRTARKHGDYSYYHLLSGVDLPIKSQDYIHKFFSKPGKNFIGFDHGINAEHNLYLKVHDYNLLNKYRRSGFLLRHAADIIRKGVNLFLSHIAKRPLDIEYKKGANWFSITQALVDEIQKQEDSLKQRYWYTLCCDEIFLQSFVWNNTELRKTLYSIDDEYKGCMRLIDWNRGNPYTWTMADKEEIMASDRLFARKFSSKHLDIVYLIRDTLLRKGTKAIEVS